MAFTCCVRLCALTGFDTAFYGLRWPSPIVVVFGLRWPSTAFAHRVGLCAFTALTGFNGLHPSWWASGFDGIRPSRKALCFDMAFTLMAGIVMLGFVL
ncbi:hypothetical protein E2562_039095 [Oryza meyeriana var. granulata]|uniref:Uncharacterized protein n=1 Tax=Oryza meyeriana var. granulata TaxID=110450 RepID=A0A6G1BQA3_9ORYZ|nr:hypothetical protein E2562_039095 [Oryza meyeriana var. granulata]